MRNALARVASQVLLDLGMQSLVFLPVKVSTRTLGFVTVISKKKSSFGPDVVDLLVSLPSKSPNPAKMREI